MMHAVIRNAFSCDLRGLLTETRRLALRRPSLLAVVVMLAGTTTVIAGCSALNPGTDAAVDTVQRFHDELAAGDTGQACALLAPNAVEGVEGGETGSCPNKLAQLSLPRSGAVTDSRAYGRSAQVRLQDDTVFLTRSGTEWKITAAGCIQRGERPYDCDVKGD
jgi:hypothetical protein